MIENQSRRKFLGKILGTAAVVALNPIAVFLEPKEVLAAGGGIIINLGLAKYADITNAAKHFSMRIQINTQKRTYRGVQGTSALLPYAFIVTKVSDSPRTYNAVSAWCTHKLSAVDSYDGTVLPCSNTDPGHSSTFFPDGSKKFSAGGSGQAVLESYPATYDAASNTITIAIPGLAVKDGEIIISQPELHQNFPNPVKEKTSISFKLFSFSKVTLTVTDALGHIISVLHDGELSSGEHSFDFDASIFPSGMYFYHLAADGEVLTKQMEIVR